MSYPQKLGNTWCTSLCYGPSSIIIYIYISLCCNIMLMSCETINNEVRHKVLHRRKGAAPKFLHHQCPKYNAIIHVVNTPAVYETLNCLLACTIV